MIEPGIHSLPAESYHDDPCDRPSLSASIAHLLVNQTPLHAWAAHPVLNPDVVREEKAHFDIGTVVHALVLEGGTDRVLVIDADSWRTRDAQEQRDDARAADLIPLLRKDWDRVEAMVDAVWAQLNRRRELGVDDPPLLTDGKPEQTLVWEESGVTCRARPDWLRDAFTVIEDFKTTGKPANPLAWSRSVWANGYDIQAVMYLRGLARLEGVTAQFRWIVAETQPPFALSVLAPAMSTLEIGQAKVERAIDKWRECVATNTWPGYPTPVYYVEVPAYEEARWLEQDAEAMTG
jgi:hypothetical protein